MPPRVDYFLTREGRSLVPILEALCEWVSDGSDILPRSRVKRSGPDRCRADDLREDETALTVPEGHAKHSLPWWFTSEGRKGSQNGRTPTAGRDLGRKRG